MASEDCSPPFRDVLKLAEYVSVVSPIDPDPLHAEALVVAIILRVRRRYVLVQELHKTTRRDAELPPQGLLLLLGEPHLADKIGSCPGSCAVLSIWVQGRFTKGIQLIVRCPIGFCKDTELGSSTSVSHKLTAAQSFCFATNQNIPK